MIHLSPSILAADFANLQKEIESVQEGGATYIHVDVMDGAFVPNISLGAPVAKSIRPNIKGVMDVHLMITDPNFYSERYEKGAMELTRNLLTLYGENRLFDANFVFQTNCSLPLQSVIH